MTAPPLVQPLSEKVTGIPDHLIHEHDSWNSNAHRSVYTLRHLLKLNSWLAYSII